MSRRPHYFAIGLFVLAANALLVLGLIVFNSDMLRDPSHFIETYVDESVQGIEIGTPFKFRGVKIGSIHAIKLVSEEYDTEKMYVMIRVALDDRLFRTETPDMLARAQLHVERGLRVKIVPQGITGLSFLDADYYPDKLTEPLKIDWEPRYTYIPSTPAVLTVIGRSIENIMSQINSLDLAGIGNNVETITSNANLTVQHIETITRQAAEVSDDVLKNVQVSSERLKQTVADMQQIVGDSDAEIDQIMINLRYVTEEIHELVRMLRKSPGTLLTEPPQRSRNE
jgi:ABC-type transporter Mla subunit MlaD